MGIIFEVAKITFFMKNFNPAGIFSPIFATAEFQNNYNSL